MLAYLFVIFALVIRLLPRSIMHFTPLGASLLFFGANRSRKEMAIPVALFAAADLYLTLVRYGLHLTWEVLFSIAWYAGALLIGSLLREKKSAPRLVASSLSASISFFLLSNFGVWVSGLLYPMTFAGLATCYLAAIPFFRNTMFSDLIFTAVFFGVAAAITAMSKTAEERGGGIAAA